MAIQFSFQNMSRGPCGTSCNQTCPDKFGCPPDRCPDFVIRRHDTRPPFRVSLEDCDGPMDVQGLVVEVNMWAKGRLKKAIGEDCEYFGLADGIGFEQIMVGDIIVMDRVRGPEYMLVIGFDECNSLVRVQRGYRNTTPQKWKKGTSMRIFRIMSAPAQTEMIFEDIKNPDGTVDKDVLSESYVVYEWQPEDTCLPGCYWLEFKVLKMLGLVLYLPGGYWTGPVHQLSNGIFYTGTIQTDSSVPLSYNAVDDQYVISPNQWQGETHLHSAQYYTGTTNNDGSVVLDRSDRPVDDTTAYSVISNEISTGVILEADSSASYPSTIPAVCSTVNASCDISFTDSNLSPRDFNCTIGEGVEWVRRFPMKGEGFLIKIENSFTAELE